MTPEIEKDSEPTSDPALASASGSDAGLKMCMYGHGKPCDNLCTLWGCKTEWCQFLEKSGRTAQHPNEKLCEEGGK